ncbi:brachyurin-like [Sitophilus oryzae]|uniref:Brachyurin-like n=1 Tax=Sitophilus oryzae TaxID=7048 RepID=A0A6J2XP16_SITOR|nr:brachyurin-like [Sitophilus oryzae]
MEYQIYLINLSVVFSVICPSWAGLPPIMRSDMMYNIVGGSEVTANSLPHQAALFIDETYFCGGSIISTRYILTAAHCVYNSKTVEIILGAHKWKTNEKTQKIFYSTTMIIHEKYNGNYLEGNDIALVKTPSFITFTWAIQSISLCDSGSGDYSGTTAIVAGWGYTSSNNILSSVLRKAYVTMDKVSFCQQYFENVTDSDLCSRGNDTLTGAVGACYGDSGGPLTRNNIQIGIVSYGAKQCEAGYPTVYTSVTYHRDWIRKYSGV